MEPITIFGVSNSVSAIANFGLELTKFLKEAIDVYPPAYPGEDLKTRFQAIDVANDALSKIEGLLREERKNIIANGKLVLFSEKALTDVQDAAVQCLKVFWRIEDHFIRKGGSKDLELRILKRLSKFLVEVRSTSMQNVDDSLPVLKLVALDETDKLSKGQKYARAFCTADKLLDRYNSQLYGLQINLLLLFQVAHLRVILTKPKQNLNDMLDLPKLYKEIRELAAETGITDGDCYRCRESWQPWTFGSDSAQTHHRRRTFRRNFIGRRRSLSSVSSEFRGALERDYPMSEDLNSKEEVHGTQDQQYHDILSPGDTNRGGARQETQSTTAPDAIMTEKYPQKENGIPLHEPEKSGRGFRAFSFSVSPTPIGQEEMDKMSSTLGSTTTNPHHEKSRDEPFLGTALSQNFEGQLVENPIDRVEPKQPSSTMGCPMKNLNDSGDWEAIEQDAATRNETRQSIAAGEEHLTTNTSNVCSEKSGEMRNTKDLSPRPETEREESSSQLLTANHHNSISATKGHLDSNYSGIGLSPDDLKGLRRHILHSVPSMNRFIGTQRISNSRAPLTSPLPEIINQGPEETALVISNYAAYIIRDFDTRGFGNAALVPSTFTREPFSEEDIIHRIAELNVQGPLVIEKKLSLPLSNEIQIGKAVAEMGTRERPNSKYEWNLAQFEETRGPFSDGSVMIYLRRTMRGVTSREALGKARSGNKVSRSQRFKEAIEAEMNCLQTLPRSKQDFHPSSGRHKRDLVIDESCASSPPARRRRLGKTDEPGFDEEPKDIGEQDREDSSKRMKDNRSRFLRSLLKDREEATAKKRHRKEKQKPRATHRMEGNSDSDYDLEENLGNASRQRRPPARRRRPSDDLLPLVVDNKRFNISPEHTKSWARRTPIHPSLPRKNCSAEGNTPVWGGSEVSTPEPCTIPTPEPLFSEDDFLRSDTDTDVDGVNRDGDINMDIVRNLYLEWTPAWEEEGENEDDELDFAG